MRVFNGAVGFPGALRGPKNISSIKGVSAAANALLCLTGKTVAHAFCWGTKSNVI